jgi:peptidoglycan/LPS O-acetylase OafA/YrhL
MRASLRRSRTLAALLLLALGLGLMFPVARLTDLPLFPLALGLACGVVLVVLADRLRRRRKAREPETRVSRVRVLPGGKSVGRNYDLAKDRSTDGQRWLM